MNLGRSTCAQVRLGCVLGASWVVFRCVLGGSRSWEAHLSLPASFCCIKPQGPGRFLRLGSSSEPPSFLFLYWAPRPMGPCAHGPMVPYQRGIERNKSRRDIEVCRSCRCSRRPRHCCVFTFRKHSHVMQTWCLRLPSEASARGLRYHDDDTHKSRSEIGALG